MSRVPAKLRAAAGLALTALLPLASAAVAPAPAATAATSLPSTLDLSGHGWGHGRGMGQYGAYGYALMGWSWQQIIGHYYGGTALVQLSSQPANQPVNVHLDEYNGSSPVTVTGPNGTWTGRTAGWTSTALGSPVTVSMSGAPTRTFNGSVSVQQSGDIWNTLPLDQYVEGVVPAEVPASWGTNGEAALQAQAVAARSYALSYIAANGYICDNPVCQVYSGDQDAPGQPTTSAYTKYSDSAVNTTSGYVIECGQDASCGSATTIARAEFSSSTGGWTAGGMFPAVVDEGDGHQGNGNPNHDWTTTVQVSDIESAFPSVGTLQSVTITKRNGLGDMGGRVEQMVLTGSAGSVTLSGDQFAAAMGLNSDWFTITNNAPGPGSDHGYWVVSSAGSVYPYGDAPTYGSMSGRHLNAPVIGMAPTADKAGYWLVGADGGIFTFGDARFYGSTGNMHLNRPVLGMASTADGGGYWLVASDGGIFTFGDARFHGSTGGMHLNKPIVAMAPTPDGGGYWLVASDGGIFTFGDARFYGSTGGMHLNAPIVGMVPTADGGGYWLVAADGGVFTFGDAGFVGSLGGQGVTDAVSVSPTPDNQGYLLVTRSGHVYPFGDAISLGDPATDQPGWSGGALGIFTRD